jgi:hypothetical protein
MADNTLAEFLIAIGFDVDSAAQAKVTSTVKKTEDTLTASVEAGAADRVEADQRASDKRASMSQALADLVRVQEEKLADSRAATAKKSAESEERIERDKAKKSRERREGAFKEASASIVKMTSLVAKFALGFEALSLTGLVAGLDRAAAGFEKLFYRSQLAGASAKSLQAFGYAASQLGASAEEAGADLDQFGTKLRVYGSGYETILKNLGIQTRDAKGQLRDIGELAKEVGPALQRYSKTHSYASTLAQSGALSFHEMTTRAMMNDRFGPLYNEGQDAATKMGVDADKTAAAGTKYEQAMRRLQLRLEAIQTGVSGKMFKKLQPTLDKLSGWFDTHGDKIVALLVRIADDITRLAFAIGDKLAKVPWDEVIGGVERAAAKFDELAKRLTGHDGITLAFEAFGAVLALKVVPRLLAIAGTLRTLTGMALPTWLLSMLGVTGTLAAVDAVGGVAAYRAATDPYGNASAQKGTGLVGLRKHQEDRDEDAEGPWGTIKRLWNGRPKMLGGSGRGMGGDEGKMPDDGKPHGAGNAMLRGRTTSAKRLRSYKDAGDAGGREGWWTPERQKYAYDYLRGQGVSERGAIALVARWKYIESTKDGPTAHNDMGGGHWGIFQASRDRAKSFNFSTDFDAQLAASAKELKSTEQRAGGILNNADTDEEAARGAAVYERAEGWNGQTDQWQGKTLANMDSVRRIVTAPPPPSPARKSPPAGWTPANPDHLRSLSDPLPPTPGVPQGLRSGGYRALGLGPDGKPLHAALNDNRPPWLRNDQPISPLVQMHRPLGDTPALHQWITTNHGGDMHAHHAPVFNISGGDVKQNVDAAHRVATRGTVDLMQNLKSRVG